MGDLVYSPFSEKGTRVRKLSQECVKRQIPLASRWLFSFLTLTQTKDNLRQTTSISVLLIQKRGLT